MISEVAVQGQLGPLPVGLWQGRNMMTDGHGGGKWEAERGHSRRAEVREWAGDKVHLQRHSLMTIPMMPLLTATEPEMRQHELSTPMGLTSALGPISECVWAPST